MNIEIPYKISETKMYIYSFELFDDFSFEYVGCATSRRNGKDDIWGHLWNKKYRKDFKKEFETLCETLYKKYSWIDEDDIYESDEYRELKNKYNPCYNKTNTNESYYSAIHFGLDIVPGYELELSIDKIKKEILKKISRKLKFVNE